MTYRIELTKSAEKFLMKLSKRNYILVSNAIDSLLNDPYRRGVKKLKGYEGVYRVKAGNCRILYEIDGTKLIVSIIEIGDRKDIYE